MDFNISDYLAEFSREWMYAEETIKLAERVRNEAVFPAIQELRYAGRRMVQVFDITSSNTPLTDEQKKECHRHAIEAIENCYKAKHDAIDAAVMYTHSEVDALVKRAGAPAVLKSFSDFQQLRQEIKAVDKIIVESRANRNHLNEKYEQIKRQHLIRVQELLDRLLSADEVFSAMARLDQDNLEKQKRENFKTGMKTGLITGIITGTITGLITGIITSLLFPLIYKYFS